MVFQWRHLNANFQDANHIKLVELTSKLKNFFQRSNSLEPFKTKFAGDLFQSSPTKPSSKIIFGKEDSGFYDLLMVYVETFGKENVLSINLKNEFIDDEIEQVINNIKGTLEKHLWEHLNWPIIILDHFELVQAERVRILNVFLEAMNDRPHITYQKQSIEPTNMKFFLLYHGKAVDWNGEWRSQLQQNLQHQAFTPSAFLGRIDEAIAMENPVSFKFLTEKDFYVEIEKKELEQPSTVPIIGSIVCTAIAVFVYCKPRKEGQKILLEPAGRVQKDCNKLIEPSPKRFGEINHRTESQVPSLHPATIPEGNVLPAEKSTTALLTPISKPVQTKPRRSPRLNK